MAVGGVVTVFGASGRLGFWLLEDRFDRLDRAPVTCRWTFPLRYPGLVALFADLVNVERVAVNERDRVTVILFVFGVVLSVLSCALIARADSKHSTSTHLICFHCPHIFY